MERPTFTEVHLERMKLVALQYITQELSESFVIEPKVEINTMLKFSLDEMAIRITQEVYGREMDRIEVRYPADWWQAFKERWFPTWAKERWPVRETVVDMVARELYPHVSAPQWEHTLSLYRHERGAWD
jgi:nuclear transport factor 2 (NTF2) superfamily protein